MAPAGSAYAQRQPSASGSYRSNGGSRRLRATRWRLRQPPKRLDKRVPQDGIGARLGHPRPSLRCPGQPRAAGAPPRPPNPQDQLTSTADGSGQLSWSLARRRALEPRRTVGATGRSGAAAWRDGVWPILPLLLGRPARLAQVACAGVASLCCACARRCLRRERPPRRRPPPRCRLAPAPAPPGLDVTFLIGIPPRPAGSVRAALSTLPSPRSLPRPPPPPPLTRAPQPVRAGRLLRRSTGAAPCAPRRCGRHAQAHAARPRLTLPPCSPPRPPCLLRLPFASFHPRAPPIFLRFARVSSAPPFPVRRPFPNPSPSARAVGGLALQPGSPRAEGVGPARSLCFVIMRRRGVRRGACAAAAAVRGAAWRGAAVWVAEVLSLFVPKGGGCVCVCARALK